MEATSVGLAHAHPNYTESNSGSPSIYMITSVRTYVYVSVAEIPRVRRHIPVDRAHKARANCAGAVI